MSGAPDWSCGATECHNFVTVPFTITSITLITTGELDSFKEQTSWFKYADKATYREIDLDFSEYNDEGEVELQPAA